MASKEMFAKLQSAKRSNNGSGNPIRQGRGRLVVDVIKFPTLFSGDTFIAEFRVKESEAMPGATEDDDTTPAVPNAVGSVCSISWIPNADPKRKEQVSGDIRLFVETLDGGALSDEEYGSLLMSVTNDESKDEKGNAQPVNPARGFEIGFEAMAKAKRIQSGKNAGKKFVAVRWHHVETSDEQIAANIAWLDGKA